MATVWCTPSAGSRWTRRPRWVAGDKRFQCPKHKSLYSADGIYLEGRATRSMDRHAIQRDGSNVVVDLDKRYEEDQDAALWKAAFVAP